MTETIKYGNFLARLVDIHFPTEYALLFAQGINRGDTAYTANFGVPLSEFPDTVGHHLFVQFPDAQFIFGGALDFSAKDKASTPPTVSISVEEKIKVIASEFSEFELDVAWLAIFNNGTFRGPACTEANAIAFAQAIDARGNVDAQLPGFQLPAGIYFNGSNVNDPFCWGALVVANNPVGPPSGLGGTARTSYGGKGRTIAKLINLSGKEGDTIATIKVAGLLTGTNFDPHGNISVIGFKHKDKPAKLLVKVKTTNPSNPGPPAGPPFDPDKDGWLKHPDDVYVKDSNFGVGGAITEDTTFEVVRTKDFVELQAV